MEKNYEKRIPRDLEIDDNKESPQVGKLIAKNEILTVQDKQQAIRVNETNRSLVKSPWEIEVEARRFNAFNMGMKKSIEKEK